MATDYSFLLADFEDLVTDILVEDPRPTTPPPATESERIDPYALAAELDATFASLSEETITDLDLWSTMQLIPTTNAQRVPIILPPIRTFQRDPVRVNEDVSASATVAKERMSALTKEQRRRLFEMR